MYTYMCIYIYIERERHIDIYMYVCELYIRARLPVSLQYTHASPPQSGNLVTCFRGSHLSNASCLTHVLFERDK